MSCTCVIDPTITCIVHPHGSPLTTEEFKSALPDKMKKSVNQQLIDKVNKVLSDPDMYETYRDNFLSYGAVMKEGRFKMPNYIDAVVYVSHKLMGKSDIAAYSTTFPEKILRFNAQGVAPKDIASYVCAYNKSKLVQLLMEQTLTPFWVLNQGVRQKALNTQAELMLSANSEKVRSDAANSVLTHTAAPTTQKVELEVTQNTHSVIDDLREATQELVNKTRKAIESGVTDATTEAQRPITIAGESRVVGR